MPTNAPTPASGPLAANLEMLGKLVRKQRAELGLSRVIAAYGADVSPATLARLESGKPVSTESMFKVLADFGLTTLVLPKTDAIDALRALGHTVRQDSMARVRSPAKQRNAAPDLVLDRTTPTILLDYDGTLHVGNALLDSDGQITLDSGRPPLEFAPLLAEILRPYPTVEIVLTTSWLRTLPVDTVMSYLPPELAQRVVDTTKDIKPRFGYARSGTGRTDVIVSYTYGKRLKNWLAIDDSVYSAAMFGRKPGELTPHFLLLDSARGISDDSAQQHIRQWLIDVHGAEDM